MLDSYYLEIAYIHDLIGGFAAFGGNKESIYNSFDIFFIILLLIKRSSWNFA